MNKPLIALTVALAAPMAAAQNTVSPTAPQTAAPSTVQLSPSATLSDVVVTGADSLLGNYLKASLSAQPGANLGQINLKQVESETLATGYFKSASATLAGNVLRVAVVSNPTIGSVEVKGLSYFPVDKFKQNIADMLNIAPGVTLNTARIDQSKEMLAQNFRTQGYPFAPNISTEVKTDAAGKATLTYTIDETAPISRIEIAGATRIPKDTVVAAFKPLYTAKKFTPDAYFKAVEAVGQAYQNAGYLQSGVDPSTSTLQGGVLKVQVVESVATSVTITGLNADQSGLQTRTGQPLTLAGLENDVKTLSNKTGKSVGFNLQPDAQNPAQVAVVFGDSQIATGPIKEVRFEGNTRLSAQELQQALKLRVGDTFSRQLAESSFYALREAYRAKGYDISTRDPISFEQGVLTYHLHEATAAKFELKWTGPHRTKDRVITRELQNLHGTVTNAQIRSAIDRIMRLGVVKITGVTTRSDDPANPEALTYVIELSDQSGTRSIPAGVSYDTLNGWQGSVGVTNNNLFGLAHVLEGNVSAQPTGSGQIWGGNISYTIPWIDVDFADFRKVPTSVSFSLASNLTPNNTLYTDSSDTTDTGRQYTTRSTGFGVTLGRRLAPNLTGTLSASSKYDSYYLEKIASGESSSYTDDQATALLPEAGRTTSFGAGLSYDSTNSGDFPTQGVRASVRPTYSFGYAGDTKLHWTTLEGGASTYYGFGRTLTSNAFSDHKQQVIALRVNAGGLFGTAPSSAIFSVGGSTVPAAYELRGIESGLLKGTKYLTSSAEYRYDFGIGNSIIQGVYGIAFADAGMVWKTDNTTKSDYGLGLGLQVNLGLNGSPLAALRFDYGFSPSNGSNKFGFRLGPVW